MIASLRAHWSEVTVMDEAGLQRLVEFRNRCASEPGVRVAYHIDFQAAPSVNADTPPR